MAGSYMSDKKRPAGGKSGKSTSHGGTTKGLVGAKKLTQSGSLKGTKSTKYAHALS